ncbi:MAG: alpha/beta hydrolase, partial [Saprospiraceae bacterium]|nr:alpha/beta hydrolase [Saprospiraceae bacterium]
MLIFFLRNYLNSLALFNPKKAGKQAYKIFSRPRKGRLAAEDMLFLETADRSEVVDYQGFTIQTYFWAGEKPTILLAHGWESNSARWQRFIEILRAEKYQIVALDAPAHGNTSSDSFNPKLYAEMLNQVVLKFAPVGFVGHSVGSYTLMFWRNYFHNSTPSVSSPFFFVLLAPTSDNRDIFNKYFHILGLNKRVQNAYYQYFEEKFGFSPASVIASDFVKNFKEKALIIHDKDDDVAPYSGSENIH